MITPAELAKISLEEAVSMGQISEPECYEGLEQQVYLAAADFVRRHKKMSAVKLVKEYMDDHQYRAVFTLTAPDGEQCTFDEAYGHEQFGPEDTDHEFDYLLRVGSGKAQAAQTIYDYIKQEFTE